ncbi:vacuolar protein sorting-associated protein 51 homolog [Trichonephila clavata]|uniref:Vacuolar protein sorting-associated protein 51 homolog n=2 Tax=Trichonephila clavata TaxID=2740835 RepID=A0A8X6M404_TRICU|nr:vacuolar protein sorting-associated protein 51 homolog [Trichonephila clavata]
MDKEEFNPDLYILKLIEDYNLHQIISKKEHLEMEIRGISNGIQSMLYDNYAKFITASDVVSKIKINFEEMEENVNQLEFKMSCVEDTSTKILKNLQPTKEKNLKLIKSKENIDKLASLINLVPKLKEYVEEGDFVTAAQHYLRNKSLLELYRHSQSFKGILEESKDIMWYIRGKLRNKLDCCLYTNEEISATLNLILDLEEMKEDILQDFLFITKDNLNQMLLKIEDSYLTGNDDVITSAEYKVFGCSDFSCKFFDILSTTIDIVRKVFLREDIIFCASSVLTTFVVDNIDRLFTLVRLVFKQQFGNISDELLSNTLDQVYRKCHDCVLQVPEIAVSHISSEMILSICRDRCEYHFRKMKYDFDTYFQCFIDKFKDEVLFSKDSLTSLNEAVQDIFVYALNSLCCYIRPEYKYSRDSHFRKCFCKVLARESVFVSFLRYLNSTIADLFSTSKPKEEIALKLCVLLARYALELYHIRAWNFISIVDDKFHASTESLNLTSMSEISDRCKETAENIIKIYIDERQRRMSIMFKSSIENKNWMMLKEPWKVSAAVRRVLEDFLETVRELEPVFENAKASVCDRVSDSGRSVNFSFSSSGNELAHSISNDRMIIRINKLFSKSSETLKNAEFTSDFILNRIMKMTLKSYLEYIRQKTFNRFGLQQIQIDVHCLELRVLPHLKNEGIFKSLFDDIISSCYSRTIQPEFMNPQVVSLLCQNF